MKIKAKTHIDRPERQKQWDHLQTNMLPTWSHKAWMLSCHPFSLYLCNLRFLPHPLLLKDFKLFHGSLRVPCGSCCRDHHFRRGGRWVGRRKGGLWPTTTTLPWLSSRAAPLWSGLGWDSTESFIQSQDSAAKTHLKSMVSDHTVMFVLSALLSWGTYFLPSEISSPCVNPVLFPSEFKMFPRSQIA